MKRRSFFGACGVAVLALLGLTPKAKAQAETFDRDSVIASLYFQLCAENNQYSNSDKNGNPTMLISDSDVVGNRGWDVVMQQTTNGIRVTLKR